MNDEECARQYRIIDRTMNFLLEQEEYNYEVIAGWLCKALREYTELGSIEPKGEYVSRRMMAYAGYR